MERERDRERKGDRMRLSIFTSSLNYENFVSVQNLFLEVRAASASRQREPDGPRKITRNISRFRSISLRDVAYVYTKNSRITRRVVAIVGKSTSEKSR